jgi:manganese transport protein
MRDSAWWRFVARLGPATIVSVGYMDPGNWATDLEGGARFGYALLWVLVVANAIALVLQVLSARLGIATGLDLAQACRKYYPGWMAGPLWVLAEIAMVACDMAELLGSAMALNLLFHVPIVLGAVLTALDSFVFLAFAGRRRRLLESLVTVLVCGIALCLGVELLLARPAWSAVVDGLVPRMHPDAMYVAIAIIGATVMPHNLYLQSALERTRRTDLRPRSLKASIASTAVALNAALLVNAAILVLSAAVFSKTSAPVTDLGDAHRLLAPLLGTALAPVLFGVGLLLSGQSSTITSTMAGQIIMEGFVRIRIPPVLRRLVTRALALVPAVAVLTVSGAHGAMALMVATQVVLSLQLPFAVAPLVRFTASGDVMGRYVSPRGVRAVAIFVAGLVTLANAALVAHVLRDAIESAKLRGALAFFVLAVLVFYALVWGVSLHGGRVQVAGRSSAFR